MITPARVLRVWLSVVAVALVFTPVASAFPITITALGNVTSIESPDSELHSEFSVGEPITLTYTYESTTPDADTLHGELRGSYIGAIVSASMTIGDYTVNTGGGWIVINDDFFATNSPDLYFPISERSPFAGSRGVAFNGSDVGSRFPYFLGMELMDEDGTALSSDELPSAAPTLSDFELRRFELAFAEETTAGSAQGVARVFGQVTSIEVVPEPSTALLLGMGLVGLGAGRKRTNDARRPLASLTTRTH